MSSSSDDDMMELRLAAKSKDPERLKRQIRKMRDGGGLGVAAATMALICAASRGPLESVEALLPFSDASWKDSSALRAAAMEGEADIVKALLPRSNPKDDESGALRFAALSGSVECLRLLLPLSDLEADNGRALEMAAGSDSQECFEMMLSASDASRHGGKAMAAAAEAGHLGRLKRLIAVSSPPIEWAEKALSKASWGGHLECAQELVACFGESLGARAFEGAMRSAQETGKEQMQAWLAGAQKAILERSEIRGRAAEVKGVARLKSARSL